MTDQLTVQYAAYNQRRLHYSFLFWACLALHFTGVLVTIFFANYQSVFPRPILFGFAGLASFLMAFIAARLHNQEISYEKYLRNIEEYWISNDIGGVQMADMTSRISSRKVVIFALIGIGLGFCVFSYMNF